MCVVFVAWRSHPGYPLVVAANRDEFHARPTAPAAFWPEAPHLLAGRDMEAGGTWMGITRGGRFAALTNYRDPARILPGARSRGAIVVEFLQGASGAAEYAAGLRQKATAYNGFNVLLGDGASLWYFSNVEGKPRALAPGVYGLSNHLLDTPWPKVARGKSALSQALAALPDSAPMLALLREERVAPDGELPRTGVSLEWERLLSAAFIRSPQYGTRSSTVLLLDGEGTVSFDEFAYGPDGAETGRRQFRFSLDPGAGA